MKNEINQAVAILRAGGVVAFPTETVYGLGADACHPRALQKIFAVKQRPLDHPVIVHLGEVDQLTKWAREIPDEAWLLAKAYWPGPLTLILKKARGVLDLVTGGQETIGLRMPNHPVAIELLNAFGGGLAAPSANRFGQISPTTARAVREELGDEVDFILEGGACAVGIESTIVDLSGGSIAVLRPGMITAKQIESILKKPVGVREKHSPRVSGSLELHYAPGTKTRVIQSENMAEFLKTVTSSVAVLVREKTLSLLPGFAALTRATVVVMSDVPAVYAHDLYETLRAIDKKRLDEIVIEAAPEGAEWDGVRDRIGRMG